MAVDSTTSTSSEQKGVAASTYRSLVTPYWPYTVYVMAYTLFGAALGAVTGTFTATHVGAVLLAVWFGLEGLHAIDLADEGVAVDLDNLVADTVGYFQVALGASLGIWVAFTTSWRFLVLVIAGTILGLAYNEEWFDGLLHDRDRITGLGNFGVSWGMVPFFAGVVVSYPGFLTWGGSATVAQTAGFITIGVAVMMDAIRLNYLEGHGAIPRYEDVGIEHNRDHKSSANEARAACHNANVLNISVWVGLALGAALLFVA